MSKSVLVKGRNAETARAVLAAAERAGLPAEVVRTSSQGGYLVPEEVAGQLGKAPVSEEFEVKSLQTRLHALNPDETGVDRAQDSPEGIQVVERSTPANETGARQTGAGRDYPGREHGEPVSAAAADGRSLLPGDRTETQVSSDISEDAEKENDPATRQANAKAAGAEETDADKAKTAKPAQARRTGAREEKD